ncbi:MAG: M23 family metallopeptidase [Candidatus Kapaibacterium sp.]
MKHIFHIFLFIVLILASGFTNYIPREDLQKQLYYFKSNLNSYETKVTEWNRIITELTSRQKAVVNRIKILSELIDNIKSRDNKNDILKQEAQFIYRNEKIEKLKNEFKKRILWLYKKGPDYQYQILFTTDSPAKFYARLQYLNKLSEKRTTDFERIKYEEFTYEESKRIKGYRRSEMLRYINEKKEDQTLLLLEKLNIDDSLSMLKSNVDNLLYNAEKLKPVITEIEYILSVNQEENKYELKTNPDYKSNSFDSLKGVLIFPVNSTNIVNDFGKSIDHNTGTIINNEGIDVSIAENSEVRCVADGIVENILDVPLYRKMIIIKHSNGFRTVYGLVKDIRVNISDKVTAGNIIAVTSQNLDGQVFHFEIRMGITPEDPKYWVARVKQVI